VQKRRLFILIPILLIGVFIWQTPNILKAIPSRYVAAYLPEPIQALAVRDHVEALPTAPGVVDADNLLGNSGNAPTLAELEATQTALPEPVVEEESEAVEASTPVPSPTATPSPTPPPPTATPVPAPESARLGLIGHIFQDWNNCGPATLAMALSYFQFYPTQSDTAAILKPNPEDRNVSPDEMAAYVNEQTEFAALTRTNGTLPTLKRLIADGHPVIVELGIDPPGEYAWLEWYGHYLLVVAYDDAKEQIWVYDSWFGTSEVPGENANAEGRIVKYDELSSYWRQFNNNYIVLYRPEEEAAVHDIIGQDMDDGYMWQQSLIRTQTLLNAEPEDAYLWFNLGTIYNALGDFEKAASAFDQARNIGLPWRMLWYQFGPYQAYYEVGRYEDVILLADTTLTDRPYFEESYYYKGLALAAMGNEEQARDNLERAVRFNPNFSPAAEALAQLTGE
jgi:tetratricopeptide (TPR) repeat protein